MYDLCYVSKKNHVFIEKELMIANSISINMVKKLNVHFPLIEQIIINIIWDIECYKPYSGKCTDDQKKKPKKENEERKIYNMKIIMLQRKW